MSLQRNENNGFSGRKAIDIIYIYTKNSVSALGG